MFKAVEARCLEALIRVKVFLKAVYALSDERCQAFSPDEKTGKSEHHLLVLILLITKVFLLFSFCRSLLS